MTEIYIVTIQVDCYGRVTDIILLICSQTLNCRPIASLDHFVAENLTSADMVEEIPSGTTR